MSIDALQILLKKRNQILFSIFFVSVILCAGSYYKYQSDMKVLKENFVHEQSAETKHQADLIELRFKYFYQGLRTMTLVPGVQNIDRYGKNLTPDTKITLQQIYNNAYLNVKMSEIYILPAAIDPDAIDPVTKKNQEPILTFDEFIVSGAKAAEAEESGPKLEEVEVFEYRLMKTQLEHFAKNYPTKSTFKDIEVPAVMGKDVITCDNAEFTKELLEKGEDFNRLGFIYTLPVYGKDEKFKGAISGILRTKVLADSLPVGSYGVYVKAYDKLVTNKPSLAFNKSLSFLQNNQKNSDLIYSDVIDLNIVDSEKWQILAAVDNDVFYSMPVVEKTKTVFWGSLFGQIAISFLIAYFIWSSFKNQIGLERKIQVRTKDLDDEKKNTQILLDNAAQGFLSFGSSGLVNDTYSQVCVDILGRSPSGQKIGQCLNQDESTFDELIPMLFDEVLEFESIAALFPKEIVMSERTVAIELKAIRFQNNKIEKVMCILSDLTELKKVEANQLKERKLHECLVKIMKSPDDVHASFDMVDEMVESRSDLTVVKRMLHTMKGNFAFLGLSDLANMCHHFEDQVKVSYNANQCIQMADKIKAELNAFIEKYNNILKIQKNSKKITVEIAKLESILNRIEQKVPHNFLFQDLTALKEQPISTVLSWMNEAFVSEAELQNKNVLPVIFKRSVQLDANVYASLFKSFIHIARNSADHGIESNEVKELNDKTALGQMTIDSWEDNGQYVISFKDNGAGIDLDRVRAKALSKNLKITNTDADAMLIFAAGFSTKENVTQSSGRGIGLDAVRSEAERFGGQISLVNQPGVGLEIKVSFNKLNTMMTSNKIAA
jgi:signal transduction histidine kinase